MFWISLIIDAYFIWFSPLADATPVVFWSAMFWCFLTWVFGYVSGRTSS